MRRRARSQSDRTLAVLADWRWHDIREIHAWVGPCRLNSRVAELRSRARRDGLGWTIEHSIRDGHHGYQLVPLTEGATDSALRKEQGGAGATEPLMAPSVSGSSLFAADSGESLTPDSGPLTTEWEQTLMDGLGAS
jgi:hypothetical protein